MKTFTLITQILLGLLFTVFGLNGFLHFIPMGPMPTGTAGQFIGALSQSHYMDVVFAIQLICGVLLLVNWYVLLALTVLGPVIVNIILFHACMAPSGLPLALIVSCLSLFLLWAYRDRFAAILRP